MSATGRCFLCKTPATDCHCMCYACGTHLFGIRDALMVVVKAFPDWLPEDERLTYYSRIEAHLIALFRLQGEGKVRVATIRPDDYQRRHGVKLCRCCSHLPDGKEALIRLSRDASVMVTNYTLDWKNLRSEPQTNFILNSFLTLTYDNPQGGRLISFDSPAEEPDYETLYEIGRALGFEEELIKGARR